MPPDSNNPVLVSRISVLSPRSRCQSPVARLPLSARPAFALRVTRKSKKVKPTQAPPPCATRACVITQCFALGRLFVVRLTRQCRLRLCKNVMEPHMLRGRKVQTSPPSLGRRFCHTTPASAAGRFRSARVVTGLVDASRPESFSSIYTTMQQPEGALLRSLSYISAYR